MLDSWLVADAEGVTSEQVELGGKTVTHVDYGDEFQDAYLYSLGDTAVIIQSGSPDLASGRALPAGPARVSDTTRRVRARRRSR